MKVIFAGSRDCDDERLMSDAICSVFKIDEIVSGGSGNVDKFGERWAVRYNVPVKRFLADWTRHGKSAGPLRNAEMAAYADFLVAVWDGASAGTADMIARMARVGKPARVFGWRRAC